jgi:hypothetical protein
MQKGDALRRPLLFFVAFRQRLQRVGGYLFLDELAVQ